MEGRARSESPDHRRCSRAIDASSPRPLITRSSPTGARSLCCVRPLFIRAALIVSHRQQRSHLVYGREAQGRVACLVILRSCPSYLPLTRARPFETSTIGKQLLCVWSPKARRGAARAVPRHTHTGGPRGPSGSLPCSENAHNTDTTDPGDRASSMTQVPTRSIDYTPAFKRSALRTRELTIIQRARADSILRRETTE